MGVEKIREQKYRQELYIYIYIEREREREREREPKGIFFKLKFP